MSGNNPFIHVPFQRGHAPRLSGFSDTLADIRAGLEVLVTANPEYQTEELRIGKQSIGDALIEAIQHVEDELARREGSA